MQRVAALLLALSPFLSVACTCDGGSATSVEGTYEASNPEGSITLHLEAGNRMRMTMREGTGEPDNAEGSYMVDGDHVTVQVPGGIPIVLVHKGDALEGSFMGQIMHFAKK